MNGRVNVKAGLGREGELRDCPDKKMVLDEHRRQKLRPRRTGSAGAATGISYSQCYPLISSRPAITRE